MDIAAKSGAVRTGFRPSSDGVTGATVTALRVRGYVWSNTADNITQVVVTADQTNGLGIGTYICILRPVRSTTTDNAWNSFGTPMGQLFADCFETVAEGTLSVAASSIAFSSLNGNTDILYEMELAVKASGTVQPKMYINGDTTAGNYGYQYLMGENTTASAGQDTASGAIIFGVNGTTTGLLHLSKTLFYAKSEYVRTGIGLSMDGVNGTTIRSIEPMGTVWSNTADNLTALSVFTANNFAANTRYRLKALKHNT
jgi:hypothetical protein